jgi:hypothetical protein
MMAKYQDILNHIAPFSATPPVRSASGACPSPFGAPKGALASVVTTVAASFPLSTGCDGLPFATGVVFSDFDDESSLLCTIRCIGGQQLHLLAISDNIYQKIPK